MERDGMEKKRLILETFFLKTGEAEVNDSSTVGGPMFSLPSLFFLAFGIWALISQTGDPTRAPLQWQTRVSTTEPPRKSLRDIWKK